MQDAGEYDAAADFEVTWCVEPQDDKDTEYIRADLVDPAAIREEALREAATVAQGYHERALEWAKKVRGLERYIGETDSSRIATAILALIDKSAPDHSAAPGNMIDKGAG